MCEIEKLEWRDVVAAREKAKRAIKEASPETKTRAVVDYMKKLTCWCLLGSIAEYERLYEGYVAQEAKITKENTMTYNQALNAMRLMDQTYEEIEALAKSRGSPGGIKI